MLAAGDLGRSWHLDFHQPRGVVPLGTGLVADIADGAQRAAEELRLERSGGLAVRFVGPHVYLGTASARHHPVAEVERERARVRRYPEEFPRSWQAARSRLESSLTALRHERLHGRTPGEIGDCLKRAVAVHAEAWRVHFAVMYRLLLCHEMLRAELAEAGVGEELLTSVLQSVGNRVLRTDRMLHALARRARDDGLAGLFEAEEGALLPRLAAHPSAGGWLTYFNRFIQAYGHRADAPGDLTTPSWLEDPEQVVSLLRPVVLSDTQVRELAEPLRDAAGRGGAAAGGHGVVPGRRLGFHLDSGTAYHRPLTARLRDPTTGHVTVAERRAAPPSGPGRGERSLFSLLTIPVLSLCFSSKLIMIVRSDLMAHPFPIARTCPFSPPDEYAEFRAEAPLVRGRLPGGPAWLVTRHAEAQQVLADETVSSDPAKPGHPKHFLQSDPPPEQPAKRPGFFLDTDPPEHTRFRRLLIPEFSLRRTRAMRPGIQRTVDALIDDMLVKGDRADLVEAFGLPVASLVICQLLGVPHEEREFFESRTRTFVTASADPARGGEAAGAMQEISVFLSELVAAAAANPGDDMLGRVVASGELSHEELVGMMLLLLMAGHETTANMIPLSVLTLLRHPAVLRELKENPELWPAAVEELLRYHSIVDWFPFDRVATRDIVVGGQEIKAGEAIFVLSASANHDERAFERPGEFDVHRDSRHHIAFGHGVHQCIGQNLARAELEIALRTLFERIPDLRVEADDEEPSAKYDAVVFGLKTLPVAW